MAWIPRRIAPQVLKALRGFPAVVLTGPRRAGKTYLLRHMLPRASYVLLEDPDLLARVRADPQGFLDGLTPPIILDEIQNAPELFQYVRARIDGAPSHKGQWLLTGSQEPPLMRGASESMAGRAAILHLLPLAAAETPKVSLLRGGYPEVINRPSQAALWFSSYVQTYLERDVRSITAIRDLALFRRFLAMVASRHGQMLNKTALAAPLGVSVPTITQWLGVLETSAQILIVPPFFENAGKRLVKSPKVYIADPGLACHLLGIEKASELARSPFRGALFEGFVASEIVKAQGNAGRRRELYYFRDEQGLEVDFLFPGPRSSLTLVECKAGGTTTPAMAAPLRRLAEAMRASRVAERFNLQVVHQPTTLASPAPGLGGGAQAVPFADFVDSLDST